MPYCTQSWRSYKVVIARLLLLSLGLALAPASGCADTSAVIQPPDPPSGSVVKAILYVDGTVKAVSRKALVAYDSEGRHVRIRLEHAEGPAEQFFRQRTRPGVGLTLKEAAPQKGEALCVLAWLIRGGNLVSRKVFLESRCQHIP